MNEFDDIDWSIIDYNINHPIPSIQEEALEIFNRFENNPELQSEFNLILRNKKIEQIKNNINNK